MSHTRGGSKAQFALAMTLYDLLNQMTSVVDRMNDVRGSLDQRGTGLGGRHTAARAPRGVGAGGHDAKEDRSHEGGRDDHRRGAAAGESRRRCTGAWSGTRDGRRRCRSQRTSAIGRELGDVSKEFERWIQIELPKINKMLEGRGLPRIEPKVAP